MQVVTSRPATVLTLSSWVALTLAACQSNRPDPDPAGIGVETAGAAVTAATLSTPSQSAGASAATDPAAAVSAQAALEAVSAALENSRPAIGRQAYTAIGIAVAEARAVFAGGEAGADPASDVVRRREAAAAVAVTLASSRAVDPDGEYAALEAAVQVLLDAAGVDDLALPDGAPGDGP